MYKTMHCFAEGGSDPDGLGWDGLGWDGMCASFVSYEDCHDTSS